MAENHEGVPLDLNLSKNPNADPSNANKNAKQINVTALL